MPTIETGEQALYLAAIINSFGDAIISHDSAGLVTIWNYAAEAMFGYPSIDIVGRPFLDLGIFMFEQEITMDQAIPRASHYEAIAKNKTGAEFPVSITVFPVLDNAGHSLGTSRSVRAMNGSINAKEPLSQNHNHLKQDVQQRKTEPEVEISERKRPEDHFRLMAEAAPNSMLMVGTDGRILLVNSQTEKLFGYDRGELLGQKMEMLVPERFRGGLHAHCASFFAAPSARSMRSGRDLFGVRKDGTEVPIEIGLNPISLAEDKFVLASIIDITERKQADERFRLVVEAAPNAMIMVGTDGRIALANSQTEKLFGYDRGELLGQKMDMLVPERFRGGHHAHRAGFFAASSARAMGSGRDLFGVRKDGTEVPIEIGLNPISIAEDKFVLASIIDITERKQADERFRLVVEAAPNAMIMVRTDGHIALLNSQTEKLFGYDRRDLLGQRIELLLPERFRSAHGLLGEGFFRAPTVPAMGSGRDLFGLRKNGTEVLIEIGFNPISSPEGNFVLTSIVDITERKRAEDEMAAAKLVESRNKDLETMLHVTSHDLREPLRAIRNFSFILSERYSNQIDDQGKDLLNRVKAGAERLDRLVQDILHVAQAGRILPPAELFPSRAMVADALRVLSSRIADTHAHIHIVDNLPYLRVSLAWGSVAVQNVVANALKFTCENTRPEIEICAYEGGQDQEVGIMIRDRGTGVPARHAERIFELFQRAVGREVEGTGAGLAIVKQIAERHGGRAWVQSREGGGSEFIITFGRTPRQESFVAGVR
jgi:PAS domain S-box-containing protein